MVEIQGLLAELISGDDARAENSIPAIMELGMTAIPALRDLTRDEDVDSRWWAVRALAASPHTRTDDLIPLLSDSAPEVRAAAALALCDHPHENAIEVLIKSLADGDPLTAGLAANALVKIGSHRFQVCWRSWGWRRQAFVFWLCARCQRSAIIAPFR